MTPHDDNGEFGETTGGKVQPVPARRARRRTEEVRALILKAARAVFAERGYAGATTRLIAARAAVAEPLIFGNFGSKGALFADAVIAPFNALLADFLAVSDAMPPDREQRSDRFVHDLYPFLRDNADLLHAMLRSGGDLEAAPLHALDDYFGRATTRMRDQYARMGLLFDVSPELAVRYTFGMLAGTVLLGDWLFPDSHAPDDPGERALARMIFKATGPAGRSPDHVHDDGAADDDRFLDASSRRR